MVDAGGDADAQRAAHEVAAETVAQRAPARREDAAGQRERGIAMALVARRAVGRAAVGNAGRAAFVAWAGSRFGTVVVIVVCHGVNIACPWLRTIRNRN
jgi:uncharacterized protein (UPF0261 family)